MHGECRDDPAGGTSECGVVVWHVCTVHGQCTVVCACMSDHANRQRTLRLERRMRMRIAPSVHSKYPTRRRIPHDMVSRTALYPARHGIPHGMASRPAWHPARHGIPPGMVSRTAPYPTRNSIPHDPASRTAQYPARAPHGALSRRSGRRAAFSCGDTTCSAEHIIGGNGRCGEVL